MKPHLPVSFFLLALLYAFVVVSPSALEAHGEAGLTFSATSTTEGAPPHIIDVDYADAVIEAGRTGRFNFSLFADPERTKPVPFTDMWVRIEQDTGERRGETIFAGGVAPQVFGGNGFSFRFSQGGKYTLSIRYNDATKDRFGETVAEAEFPFEVLRSADENVFNVGRAEFWIGLIGGLFVALLGLLPLLMRKKQT